MDAGEGVEWGPAASAGREEVCNGGDAGGAGGEHGAGWRISAAGVADRPLLGPPMHTAALTHAPVNEMGVSVLFAMMARKLGFIIESVQAAFPDCRAKMEVTPGRWQDVRIEFEYESRNFALHGHDPTGCDVIVCWRHNWKACPPGMMVVELSKLVV